MLMCINGDRGKMIVENTKKEGLKHKKKMSKKSVTDIPTNISDLKTP